MPVVPIPPEVWRPTGGYPYDDRALEAFVNQFIAANKLRAGDKFNIPYPHGSKEFQVIPDDPNNRVNWMEAAPPKQDVPMS